MNAALGFSENSQRASETSFAYGKVKRAELGRNIWTFATRRAVLRSIDVNTLLLAPTLWARAMVLTRLPLPATSSRVRCGATTVANCHQNRK
jgi:hypothetical protein